MRLFFRRLLSVITVVMVIVAITALVLIFAGFRPFIIDSPSMEPLYKEGSLCWVRLSTPLSELSVGDVIAYRTDADMLVLHRITAVLTSPSSPAFPSSASSITPSDEKSRDELRVITSGDANNVAQEVNLSRVNYIGKEAFTIPGLGAVVSSLSGLPWLIYLLIGALLVVVCLPFRLPFLSSHGKKGSEGKHSREDTDGIQETDEIREGEM